MLGPARSQVVGWRGDKVVVVVVMCLWICCKLWGGNGSEGDDSGSKKGTFSV